MNESLISLKPNLLNNTLNNSTSNIMNKEKPLGIILNNKIFFIKKLINMNKENISENTKRIKIRNVGVDMVRILGMLAIVIHHILIHGKVIFKYKYRALTYINIWSFWHVNSFALISGIVGFKTNKYSNLMYLWLCVVFYQFSIHYLINLIIKFNKKISISNNFYSDFFPVIFYKYWYFSSYFGMYLLLPIINKGLAYITKVELKILILSTLGIYILYNDSFNPRGDPFKMNYGYSCLWLVIYFITGSYIGKYHKIYKGIKKIFFCIGCLITYILSSFLCCKLHYYTVMEMNNRKLKLLLILKNIFIPRINSLPMILQSLSLTLFFLQINYNIYI